MANTYIAWTPSSAGERKKWTMSVWLKRSATGVQSNIYNQYKDGNYYNAKLTIQSDDRLNFVNYAESTTTNIRTTRQFRDTSAWYHIVLAVDTTEDSSDNRCKFYVNGVRETSFATNTRPALNLEMFANQTQPQQWGVQRFASSSQGFFNGSMSYIAFIDGKAELPTIFGETDSTTGEWKIKTTITPSSAWGSNGYLILKDGNSLSDQSTNSNNFSLSGGTLTNTKDCPDNVFCTLNSLMTTVPTAGTNNGTTGTFTNGNLTWTSTNAVWNSRGSGNMFVDTGKFYWETKMNTGGDFNAFIGISPTTTVHEYFDATMGRTGNFAYYKNGQKYIGSSASSYGDAWVAGDIIGVALDATNSKLYFSKNGAWQNSGNPESGATGTGAIPITANTLYAPRCTIHNMGMSFNFGTGFFGTTAITTNSNNGYAGAEGASKFNYQPPTGYNALSTKGLNN